MLPLTGSSKGDKDVGACVDIDRDIDSDMTVSVNCVGPLKEV